MNYNIFKNKYYTFSRQRQIIATEHMQLTVQKGFFFIRPINNIVKKFTCMVHGKRT